MFFKTLTATATLIALGLPAAHAASHSSEGDAQGDAGAMSGEPRMPAAGAQLLNSDGEEVGAVNIWEGPNGLLFQIVAEGMEPGVHGFHVHETGECSGDFTSAGDHIAGSGGGHGFLTEDGPHAGDLPNVYAHENGRVEADAFGTMLSLSEGDAPIMDDDGSAIIIHEMGDSYASDAGAGGRVACGVIEASM